ncbi:MAG: peptidoglycan-binding protein [bacterium]|nr:peptidoglycan-binding protein [bacterium]
MKKTLIIFLSILVLAAGNSALAGVSIGTRSEEVKNIQEALRADSTIFPGQATGYFGPVTQKAVQKVQVKCNLPQTGVVDDETYKCIFPVDYKVTVVSPNGGEIWDRGQIQTVKWSVTYPIELKTNNAKIMPPHWSKASIDLFRRSSNTDDPGYIFFVKHIATVNLFANSYSWKISSDIPNGSDYVVRISVGQGTMTIYRSESDNTSIKPDLIWPSPSINWDESDNPFSITGSQTPPNEDLKELLNILEEMSRLLAKAIQVLQGIISK